MPVTASTANKEAAPAPFAARLKMNKEAFPLTGRQRTIGWEQPGRYVYNCSPPRKLYWM